MTIILFAFFALLIPGFKYAKFNTNNNDFLSREDTTSINGIFVFLVFLSHAVQYLNLSDAQSAVYLDVREFLAQGVVTTFLLFSGYGMMEAIQIKKQKYINGIPKKFIKLFIFFAVAATCYILLGIAFGNNYSIERILLIITSIQSTGNSNWYITVMFILYIITFIIFTIIRPKNKNLMIIASVVLLIVSIGIMFMGIKMNLPTRYYNTLVCYPLGMLISLYKDIIIKIFKNNLIYFIVLLLLFIAIFMGRNYSEKSGILAYMIYIVGFVLLIVLLNLKIKFTHPIANYLGNNVFEIYILQRIPMIILANLGLQNNYFLFLTVSLIVTMILSELFNKYVRVTIDRIIK